MSPWLFNMCMDGVVREVNAMVQCRGVELVGRRWECQESESVYRADDTLPIGNSRMNLHQLPNEFDNVTKRR